MANLALSASAIRDDIVGAAVPGIAGFFLLFLSRYFLEYQHLYDMITRLESENAQMRERLGAG